jgi:GalNAc-alpha-(1->4)-GalNAc-alpha-(1->3)-diNAcBac-PP-undecaprenol alpha-1,4-N-acetyl-D-galactosaminyltransferase
MVVIPNAVPVAEMRADPVGGRKKLLLCIGGLRPEKNHASLIAAFAQLASDFPHWSLRIVGEGPLRMALHSQAQELSIAERVELVGAVQNVSAEYRRAQLFVLPSSYEAFPNCIAEALAHGLPAVGFAECPGTNELIIPGLNGGLAEGIGNFRTLAVALARLMACAADRRALGDAAPATVERFSLGAVTDRWEEVLKGVISPVRR